MIERTQAASDRSAGDTSEWEARFEGALATMLRQYLNDDPPPTDSAIGCDAARWAENLEARGQARRAGRTEETPRRAA